MPEVIFNGPDGRLEGRYHHNSQEDSPVAVVLHPDPRHGGTMNNKLVYTLYQNFARAGYSVLRFNFRGVGKSEGVFDRGEGELSDAASALDWLQAYNPGSRSCWVAGFSFGGWIAMQLLMRRPEIERFIAISPPANIYDFSFLAPCPSSGLVVQGENDEIVPEPSVKKLIEKLMTQRDIQIDYKIIKGANHFFQNEMDQVVAEVDAYTKKTLKALDKAREAS